MKKIVSIILCLIMVLGMCATSLAEEPATIVLKNGAVYTMNDDLDVVSAIAIKDNKIVYVGDDAGAEAFVGEGTQVVDLEGKMVTPGFMNGHDHFASLEYSKRTTLEMPAYSTLEEYQAAIVAYAEAHPELESIGGGAIDLKVFGDEIPNSKFLTECLPDTPAMISDISGHGQFLNQAAMDLLGITEDYEEVPGSTIYRYEDGSLTGYFSDHNEVLNSGIGTVEFDKDVYIEAVKEFMATANSYGMTALNDGGSSVEKMEVLSEMGANGELTMRLQLPLMANTAWDGAAGEEAAKVLDSVQDLQNDFVRMNQVKNIIDGVPEGKSALLLEPYAETAGMGDDFYGPNYCTQEELNDFVAAIDKAGYSVLIHSMGDGGVHMSVTAFANAADVNGTTDNRHTVIHTTLITDEDIQKAAEYGIFLNTQPVWFYVEPQFGALELQMFGEERFYNEYNMRDRVEAGCKFTGGSDYSVTMDFSPLSGIECGVTMGSPYEGEQGNPEFVRDADQTVSVMEMLKCYTIYCAEQAHMEDLIGSLEVGKMADITVLGQDITKCDPLTISETEVVATISDGRVVYGELK